MTINFDKVPKYIRKEIDAPSDVISNGSKNQTVQRIQEWLNFHQCRTEIDGDYGPATESCVRDFQSKKRMRKTGEVDKNTWSALVRPMRDALQAPGRMPRSSVPDAVKKIAKRHVDQHPVEIGGPNGGPWVRLYCEGNDGNDWAWCAGFVTLILQQACFYLETGAPIKGSVSCDTLAAQARQAGRFVSGRSLVRCDVEWASFGGSCIFLRRRTETDWTHAGIALSAEGTGGDLVFCTIEGNTNDEGVREGFEACRRTRGLGSGNYDFISLA